jgi:type I restriction enzyme R subunit
MRMATAMVHKSPFLDISPQGRERLFPVAKVEQMVQVLDEIRRRAVA